MPTQPAGRCLVEFVEIVVFDVLEDRMPAQGDARFLYQPQLADLRGKALFEGLAAGIAEQREPAGQQRCQGLRHRNKRCSV